MKNFALKQHSSRNRTSVNLSRVICYKFGYLARESIGRFIIKSCVPRSAYHRDIGLAQSGRRLDESVEHCLQVKRRAANDPEHVGRRSLLLQRLIALAGELGDIFFLAGSEVTATACGLWRIATPRQRLAASRLYCFAACFVVPPHHCPLRLRTRIVAAQTSTGEGPAHVRVGSKADMCSANGHVRFTPNSDHKSRHPQMVMSALPPKADMCTAIAHVCFGPKADMEAFRP